MRSLLQITDIVLNLYMWVVIISVIVSWLIAFNVINTSNQFVYAVINFLHQITEPVLRRIRMVVPGVGGIDLSPLILLLAIYLVRMLLFEYAWPLVL